MYVLETLYVRGTFNRIITRGSMVNGTVLSSEVPPTLRKKLPFYFPPMTGSRGKVRVHKLDLCGYYEASHVRIFLQPKVPTQTPLTTSIQ